MEYIEIFNYYLDYLRQLNIYSMVLRVVLAMLVGGLIGLERERKGRPAGFRTYMLVAMGAATTVMLSQYYGVLFEGPWAGVAAEMGIKTDISRFGAQVINGVGFLGAGTIIVTGRQEVKGLTTAACLWASACMGLAVGAGFYECVFVGFFLILISIKFLPRFDQYILSKSRRVFVFVEMDSIENLGVIINHLKEQKINLFDIDLDKVQPGNYECINALMGMFLPRKLPHAGVIASISTLEGVLSIEEV
jgi:putative Mg2+ transporter-C (MgtC) family protein